MIKFDITKLQDFDYYARNYLWIQAGEGLIQFDYSARFVQREINKEWERHKANNLPIRLIILKARRHGVSTYVQSRMFHECHTKSHRQGITIAADDEGCSYIHNMAHVFYEYLPPELQPETKYKSSSKLVFDIPKAKQQKFGGHGLKSSMRTVACTNKAGLGSGSHFIHFSEYANYRDAENVRKAIIPTAFQEPGTFVVIESTANGMVGPGEHFYEEWKKAKAGKSVFKPLFFSWLDHEQYTRPFLDVREKEKLLDTIDEDEKELQEANQATLEQLNWRREQITFLGAGLSGESEKSGLENFHEQYPTTDDEAFIVSGNNVFDRAVLKKYKRACRKPEFVGDLSTGKLIPDSLGRLKIWEHPIPGEKYVAGIDPASGEPGSTDFGGIEILRVLDRREGAIAIQVAEWHGRLDAKVLGWLGVDLAVMYNKALLVPEAFGYGHAVIDAILDRDYWNVIKRKVMDAMYRVSSDKYGWKTDPTSKPSMLTLGRYCINNELILLNSESLIDEMMIFIRDAYGPGANAYGRGKDDLVMAFLIALSGLEQEYGEQSIYSKGVLPPAPESGDKPDVRDKLHYDDFDPVRGLHKKHWLDL
jgi:hypothetical protein